MKRRFDRKFTKEESQNILFTSDTHFGHEFMIECCEKPCSNVEEMDEMLINNWNNVCNTNSIVYHLGDFIFGGQNRLVEIIINLKFGELHLILGNHDLKNISKESEYLFDSVSQQQTLQIDGREGILIHNPFLCYGDTYRKEENQVWQLFGHVHTRKYGNSKSLDEPRLSMLFPTQYDVGVDNNDWKPISWNNVKIKIEEQIKNEKNGQ